MKQVCICCDKVFENAAGFQTKQGFICMRHEFAEMATYTVSYSGMSDIVFKFESDAEFFISEDMLESESKREEYKIKEGKMNCLEFNNLEEWDG